MYMYMYAYTYICINIHIHTYINIVGINNGKVNFEGGGGESVLQKFNHKTFTTHPSHHLLCKLK
jgi:hypothetical protein